MSPVGGPKASSASLSTGLCFLGPALQWVCNRVTVSLVSLEPKLHKGILTQLLKTMQKCCGHCAINAWLSESA